MEIRPVSINDAEKFLEMQRKLDSETEYMLLKPEERTSDISYTKQFIEKIIYTRSLLLIAENEKNKPVGYVLAQRSVYKKNQHLAYIVVGILKAYQGVGIGSHFFSLVDEWAKKEKIVRLELTVMATNQPALHLYEKQGFYIEGTRQKSIFQNGFFIDEYFMAKIFNYNN